MTRMLGCWVGIGLAAAVVATARAQGPCLGDCDGSRAVAVNEVLRCVGIALGSSAVGDCTACDPDGDGQVPIADLILAIRNVLEGCTPPTPTVTPGPTPPSPPCGDGLTEGDEECDDGNTVGGDGCAANCTNEQRRLAMFDPKLTSAVVQSEGLPVTLNQINGSQVLSTGSARATTVVDVHGRTLFTPGEMPVVIRAADLQFKPISIPGARCACVRGVEATEFGAGNVASGVIACGGATLQDIDSALTVDHNTSPGSAANSGPAAGLPDDPECDDCSVVGPLGSRSCACQEVRDAACADRHLNVCNSPRVLSRSGGAAEPGSAFLVLNIAIGLLQDGGACEKKLRNGRCTFADYGPDCEPCTADDVVFGVPNLVVATTGHATATVIDVNNAAGVRIADGSTCFGTPCAATTDGHAFSCPQLAADPEGGLAGGALAVCFPGVDTDPLGDTVTCTRLAAQ